MNVRLFGNYQGDRQWSMRHYARALKKALRGAQSPPDRVRLIVPPGKRPDRVHAYWSRYVVFPALALRYRGTVNHILDHGYSYLIHFLPASRTLITCHDLLVSRIQRGLLPQAPGALRTNWIFNRQIQGLRKAAHIIAVSEQTRKDLIALLKIPPEKISVIYNGVDSIFAPLSPQERERQRRALGWDRRRYTLLHVGSASFYKNIEVLLRALSLLRSRYQMDVHLARAGDPWSPADQSLIRRLKLEDRVQAVGHVSKRALQALYGAADVFVFPSWWEGFGWPPLEAMACGTPVVASQGGALAETLNGSARTVDPADPQDVCRGIKDVLENERLRESLQAKGFECARRFSWEKAAESLWRMYERLAKN